MKWERVIGILASLLMAGNLWAANYCSDPILDETGAMSSNQLEKVAQAIKPLKDQGADVKVRVLKDMKGHPTLNAMKDSGIEKCGSWKGSQPGSMKNNLILIMVVPGAQKTAFFYGDALKTRLDGKYNAVMSDMNAKFRDGDIADGLIIGLTDAADLNGVKISQQDAKQVVINHAADNTAGWIIAGWIIAILSLIGLGWFGVWLFGQKEVRRSAQRTAQTERGRCTSVVNNFEIPSTILKSKIRGSNVSEAKKARLLGELESVKGRYDTTTAKLAGIDRGQNDPDTPNLSVQEYENIAESYRKIANDLEMIQEELEKIERKLKAPELSDPPPVQPRPQEWPKPSTAPRREASKTVHITEPPKPDVRRERPTAPVSTTATQSPTEHHHYHDCGGGGVIVINNESGHRRDEPHYEPIPPTTTSRGSGEESSFGKASIGGNGGEGKWGESTGGNGATSSWVSPDFGSQREETTTTPSPSDCRPSDCDCRPTDCASDCTRDCDCNCDCSSND